MQNSSGAAAQLRRRAGRRGLSWKSDAAQESMKPEQEISETSSRTFDPGRAAERAEELFQGGWNCAESVFLAVHGQAGPGEAPVHLVTALGGGMGKKKTCGALTGGIVALGLAFGRRQPDEAAKKEAYARGAELYQDFRDRFGSVDCWQLTCHYQSAQEKKRGCSRLVRMAAERACALIAERRRNP